MDALTPTMRRLWAVVVLGLVAALVPTLAPAPALADAGLEQRFVAAINAERAEAGLAALSAVGDLTTAARRHAQTMAGADHLHHNPGLGSAVGGWQKLGENVGRGPGVDAIHQAFMDSPGHRRNVLDPAFTEVGIGVVVHDGQLWVTEMFRLPTNGAPSTPAPATSAPVTPAPAAPAPAAPAPPAAPAEPTAPTPAAPAAPAPTPSDEPAPADVEDDEAAAHQDAGSGDAGRTTGSDAGTVPLPGNRLLLVQLRVAAHDA